MKRVPQWAVWLGLALAVWLTTSWLILGVMAPRKEGLHAEEANLRRQQVEAKTLITAAPRVVAQVDSIETEARNHLARLITTDDIPRLLSEIEDEGRRRNLEALSVVLDLSSTMSIPLERDPARGETVSTHTLRLSLGVEGAFEVIGTWLDAIEDRVDFQEWIECRWEDKTHDGRISFSGEAEFWIITPPTARTIPSEDNGG
jgi:hypothetical protein